MSTNDIGTMGHSRSRRKKRIWADEEKREIWRLSMASRLGIAEVGMNDCFQRYLMQSSHPQRMTGIRPSRWSCLTDMVGPLPPVGIATTPHHDFPEAAVHGLAQQDSGSNFADEDNATRQ